MSDDLKNLPLFKAQYKDENHEIEFNLDAENETVWATTKKLAELFDCSVRNIENHIENILKDDELKENSTTKKIFVVQKEDDKAMKDEDLNAISESLQVLEYDINLSLPTQNIIEKINKKIQEENNINSDKFIQNIQQDNLELKENNDFDSNLNKFAKYKKH